MEIRSMFKSIFGKESDDKAEQATQRLELLNDHQDCFFNRENSNDILVKTCIDVIAKHVAKLHANHLILKDNKKTPKDGKLNEILTLQPNEYMNSYDFFYKIASQALLSQNAFIKINRDRFNQVISLWLLDYGEVEAMESDNEIFLKFTFKTGKKKVIPYADLIHIRHRFQNGELVANTFDNIENNLKLLDILQQSFANAAINSGKIKGVAKISGQSGSEAWTKKAEILNNNIKNAKTGGIVVTDSTIDFAANNAEPVPADHTQIEYLINKIYQYYGISKEIISNKYSESDWQSFYESTIEPFAIQLSQEFTRKIFTEKEREQGNCIIFDANRLTYANTQTKTEMIRQLMPLGILTINQALEIMNLPPVNNGNRRIQTLNVCNIDLVDKYQKNHKIKPRKEEEENENE